MSDVRKAEKHVEAARAYDVARDWRNAERCYLLAAQELATSSLKAHVALRRQWDAAAKRAHRLAQLEAS